LRARISHEHHWQHSLQACAHALGWCAYTVLRTDACRAYKYLGQRMCMQCKPAHSWLWCWRPQAMGTGCETWALKVS